MISKMLLNLLAMSMLLGCARAPGPAVGSNGLRETPIAIVGVTVVPMSSGAALLPNRTVVVRNGRIDAIGPSARLPPPAGARVIDGRGRYLMPALSDAHVHLEYSEDPATLGLFLANGVATVRNMDGRPFILQWRDRIARGELLGPRIVTAGPIIDGSPPLREDNLAVADPEAARAAVADQAAKGYDFIKLYTNLSPDAYAAAVDEAKRRGLRVAGHVPRGVPLAAAAQQWSIEHLGDFASAITTPGANIPSWAARYLAGPIDSGRLASLSQMLAATGVWIVPTAVQKDRELAPPEVVSRWLEEPAIRHIPAPFVAQWRVRLERFQARMDNDDWALLEQARRNRILIIGALYRGGVRLSVGSDTPNPFVAMGASVHLELANFVAAGLTPRQALAAATIDTARMLGLDKEQGTVEQGKRADLLLLTANPLEDVSNASKRVGLLLSGRWLPEEELQALPALIGR